MSSDTKVLSGMRLDSEMKLTATELEFLAEDEIVNFVPRFKFDQINLIGGSYGPFQPMVPTQVPLWFALQLVQRKLGKVQPPDWLQNDSIDLLWEKEDRSRELQLLQEVPFHYQEVSTLLLRHCPESFAGMEGGCCVFSHFCLATRESVPENKGTSPYCTFSLCICHSVRAKFAIYTEAVAAVSSKKIRKRFRMIMMHEIWTKGHARQSIIIWAEPIMCWFATAHVRIKLKDIEDLREAKLQVSLRDVVQDYAAINVSNIGAMEMNKYGPTLLTQRGHSHFRRHLPIIS